MYEQIKTKSGSIFKDEQLSLTSLRQAQMAALL